MSYKLWILVAISLFVISGVVGWSTPDAVADLLAKDIAALQELGGMLAALPPVLTALFILAKNSLSLVFSFVLSPLLCFIPIMALIANGWLLGWISATVIEKGSLGILLGGLLPHGVIELPAFIIGEAAALSFGSLVMISLLKKEYRVMLWPHLKQNLRYLAIALALLVPAALIEAFITPLFIK